MKVLKIDGIKGMITMAFVGICLFAGFVIFPGYVSMTLWNKFLAATMEFPVINVLQGILLWGIAVVAYCIVFKNGFAVSFLRNPSELSEAELNMIMQNARMYSGFRSIKKTQENPYFTQKKSNQNDNQDLTDDFASQSNTKNNH